MDLMVESVLQVNEMQYGLGYTRDWLPADSFVLRARARRDTTRQDYFLVIPAHTGLTIVYCGAVVPTCSSQMSARWLSITSQNACEHSVNKSEGDWLLGVLVLRWTALRNGSPGNCSSLCSCSLDTEEENKKTVLGTSHLQLQTVKRKILHPVRKSTWTSCKIFFILPYEYIDVWWVDKISRASCELPKHQLSVMCATRRENSR
jgi:hypothetical protein